MSSIKEEIEAVDRKFMDLFAAGDFTGMSNLYTEDCKLMPTGSPMVEGRDAAAKLFQSVYDSGCKKVKLVEEEVGPAGGDVIYSRGLYTFYLEDGKEGDAGKFVILWKRVNGVPFFYTDIFNNSNS